MRHIKFYISKTTKWILYNSLLLSIILFCVFQIYGTINDKYFNDNLDLIKSIGATGLSEEIDFNKISKLKKHDKFKNISYILEKPIFENGNREELEYTEFTVIFGNKENILKMGDLIDNNSSGKVIVSQEYFGNNGYLLNDKIKIEDKEFTIVGVSNYEVDNNFIISYKDYKNLGLKSNYFHVRASDSIKRDEVESFVDDIKDIFNNENIRIQNSNAEFDKIKDEIFFASIVFILGLLNMFSLYKFTINKKSKLINVLMLSGSSKKQIYISEIISILITFVLGNIIAILIYKFFNKFILNILFNINISKMDLINFIYVFLAYILIYIISMSVVLFKNFTVYISKNIKENSV